MTVTAYFLLCLAAIPFIYYGIALYSSWRFFHRPLQRTAPAAAFAPPLSILKPVRGLDPEAYENFASFCRQDYPDYEMVFCADPGDPSLPVIEKLIRDFPERRIRVLFGSGRTAVNDKVAKLVRLVHEAQHEILVISDSDARVELDYLRAMVAPLADPRVGAVTCFYASMREKSLAENLQTVAMFSDFYAALLVAWQIDGIKFALGPSIATSRANLAKFGGYEALENRPADDLLVGRLIAGAGLEVVLLPYAILTVADFESMRGLVHKRLRWMVVMRHMRPWGHIGLILTLGLPWSLAAVAIHPSVAVACGYLGIYALLRTAMTWVIGVRGLKQHSLWRKMALIPAWDAFAFGIWLGSFSRKSIRWRNAKYYIEDGLLVPAASRGSRKRRPGS